MEQPRPRRRQSFHDLALELDLLFPNGYDRISTMDQGRKLRDKRIEDLRKTNGTLQEGYERILKDMKHVRGRRHMLREYYERVNKILQDTRAISRQEQKEFLAEAEKYIADLGNKRYTILIAGETSAGKSSLINLLLNDHVLPTAIIQNTHTICEISYGARKEAVIHFSKSSKLARILNENKFAKIKEYIEKPVQDEDSCKRIEIKIPNPLLKGGVVIVDSPGIGDTEKVNKKALEYLPQAHAFIYVINSSNAGGLQEDRLLRILREWIKLYKGEKPCGITFESALFVCNKWDEVEKQGSQKEDLKRHIADKLREKIPDLDEKTQVIKLSALTAAEVQGRFEVMSDDLKSLIDGLQRLLPLCIERKSEHLYRWISGQLGNFSDHLKGAMRNAKRCGEERLKVREELKVKLEKLKQGTFIQEIEDKIEDLVKKLGHELTSHFQSAEVRLRFRTWKENDLSNIDDRHTTNAKAIKETYSRCIGARFQSFFDEWENREKLFAKAYEDLERQFQQNFYDFEKEIRGIDGILVGDTGDKFTPLEIRQGNLLTPLHPNMKTFLAMTLGIFMPVLIPVGLAVGVLSAPVVIGYLAIDKHIKERQLKKNPSRALADLSTEFLDAFINDKVLPYVRELFAEETNRIARIRRCHQHLITRYEQKCKDLTRDEDESRDKEILETFGPLEKNLQEITENLTFDGIENGIQVMYPPCQMDIKRLRYDKSENLGAGSYGTVFKGKFTPQGHRIKDVAVKELKEAPSPSNVVSFLHEAATVKQLKHKHIVTFYGVAIDVKDHKLLSLLLVFELCTGSLKSHIFNNDDRIPWKTPNAAVDTLQWTKQILDALEFIHSQNIVHRDLKLDNILISRHEHIKVADLGLAKLQGRILGTVCGTPLYMAPEVQDGKPYCTKADIYSFGLMMWELWFGKRVFSELSCRRLSRDELLRRIKEENYRPQTPRSGERFVPNLPPAQWTELMTSCWQTESSLRKTAAESKDFVKEIKHSLAEI